MMDNLAARIIRIRPAAKLAPLPSTGCFCLEDRGDGLGLVIVFWDTATLGPQPTEAELLAADPTSTVEEKLDRLDLPRRVLKAVALRLSESWTTPPPSGATAAEKAKATAIINTAGLKVLDTIRS